METMTNLKIETKPINSEYFNLAYARVLIVDDLIPNLYILKALLKPYQVQSEFATRGMQAVDMIRAGTPKYNAIFLDYIMPGISGLEAARMIREDIGTEYAKNIPIIAYASESSPDDMAMLISSGFQALLPKPVNTMLLDSILRQWVRDDSLENNLYPVKNPKITSSSDTGAPPCFLRIDGIDVPAALSRFKNDKNVYIRILRSYVESTRPLVSKMTAHLAFENLGEYIPIIHGIKSSSYGIFANEIGALAESLEHTARSGALSEIRAKHFEFERKILTLLDNMDLTLSAINSFTKKPEAYTPDPRLLEELTEACRTLNMDKVYEIMFLLESRTYKKGENVIRWLREQIKNMTLEAITTTRWSVE